MHQTLLRVRSPLLVLATVFALVILHECGHILASRATGGHVVHVDLMNLRPNVRIGGPSTDAVNAFRALAGSGAVLVLAFSAVLLLPVRGLLSLVRETACFFAAIEILGWFLSAVVHASSPQSNDAGKFLQLTGLEPWMVALVCLLLAAIGFCSMSLRQGLPHRRRLPAPDRGGCCMQSGLLLRAGKLTRWTNAARWT